MKSFSQSGTQKNSLHAAGFTLPELLIVCAIIVIMTGVALANYKIYTSDAALSNTAHDLSLTIRETQLYGISVKESTTGAFGDGYGLHFLGSTNTSFITYEDIPSDPTDLTTANKKYDDGELVTTNDLPKEFTISRICSVISKVETCLPADGTNSGFVDIEFVRPNPDMIMTTNVGLPTGSSPVTYDPTISRGTYYGARIYLTSGTKERSVYIDKTGQISVN